MEDSKVKETKMVKKINTVKKTVRVTQTIINRAAHRCISNPRSENCPIALALRKLDLPYATEIEVGPRNVKTNFNGCIAILPSSARQFIRNFDRHQPVKPFRFDIRLPKEI